MPTFSQTASLSSDKPRQVSPDYLGIRRVASRKRKTMGSSVNHSSCDYEASQSAVSSEAESCADRLHFAHAAEQLVAAASLVASLSFSTNSSTTSNSSHEISNTNTRSISPSTSSPSSPTDSGEHGRSSTPGSLKGLTIEERRQRRLIRNREAAKECRKKKKQYVSELEEKVQKLEDENDQLQQEIQELQAKLTLSIMHKGKEAKYD